MADGTFAALMFILGLSDMQSNHCGTELGCLGRSEGTARIYASAGEVVKRRARPGPETYFRYDLAHKTVPLETPLGFLSPNDRKHGLDTAKRISFKRRLYL